MAFHVFCSAYTLLRADAGRLPFATGSVAAIHAGAAIHCWPDPMAAVGFCLLDLFGCHTNSSIVQGSH